MGAEPPALGKGLFGYRKAAVNQILSDRDVMLRQAEGRVRAAESKVAQLEGELGGLRDRNSRMEEQLERLRVQLNTLISQGGSGYAAAAEAVAAMPGAAVTEEQGPTTTGEEQAVEEAAPPESEERSEQAEAAHFLPETVEAPSSEPDLHEEHEPFAHAMESESEPWPGEEPTEPAEALPPVDHEASAPVTEEPAEHPAAAESVAAKSADYHPGADADAFGYHGTEFQEDETPYGYRYEWPAVEPSPAPPAAEESAEPTQTWSPHNMDETKPTHDQAEQPAATFSAPAPAAHQPAPREPAPTQGSSAVRSHPAAEAASRFVTEELAGILTAAEESAARIVERARETSDRQLERSNRMWSEVQSEVARFAAWRDEVEPVIRTVQSKVENVRAFIEEVPERIREALAPMAESISSIDTDLAELSAACNPPLLLTPSVLQSEGEEHSSSQAGSSRGEAGDGSHSDPLGGPTFGYSAS
ncbi:MAG TPA: hypothetical protein VKK30_04250 [Actinomycetota bacterium]|nr:hypothetical protein [Actinomycetota bacterium]